uniref:Crinkler effector protein N-terminal domain-containing protein n=1 Tax=Rhizophagus irregularis (strain DAOM 181602 / DAOM 197198 / MUCL 43194) TaxID=747089 RepID=U9U2M1_RHIID
MAQMVFNCFILGDTRVFPAVLGENITINDDTIPFENFNDRLLMDYILEKKRDVISSSNIDLWKVEIEETNENIEKLVNTEINIREVFRGDTTKLAKKIFSGKPPDKHIHIIIGKGIWRKTRNKIIEQKNNGNKFPRLPGNDGDMDAYNQECYNVTDITQLGGFCETLFEMVTYTIIRQGGDFQVHKLTDDGTQSECEINGFDYLEENFFDNVEEIQGPVKYY